VFLTYKIRICEKINWEENQFYPIWTNRSDKTVPPRGLVKGAALKMKGSHRKEIC